MDKELDINVLNHLWNIQMYNLWNIQMYNGQERREYKRIEKPYRVRFKIRSDEAQEMGSDVWDSVTLHNLSVGSAVFFYNKDLGIGTLLDLKIEVPKSTLTINCVGKIIRIDKTQHTSMYGIAIKLINIGEQEKKLINKAIEEILSRKPNFSNIPTTPYLPS